MIFYFSGTGNSLYAAKRIALHHNDALVSISAALNSGKEAYEYSLRDHEKIGFVFPTYAWGPPRMVLDFIGKLKLNHYRGNYIFAVATCGGNIANTMKVIDARLKDSRLELNGQFSIVMPNSFILMGDVDSKSREQEKLAAAEVTLNSINYRIGRQAKGEFGLVKGRMSWLLTGINSMFQNSKVNTAKFYVTDKCSGCGTCARVCNCYNIQVNGTPRWGQRCSQCLACIHHCPSQAIQYGKSTVNKGRYTHPKVSLEEMTNRFVP